MDGDSTKKKIAQYSTELGFDLVRISSPNLPERNYDAYRKWIKKGHHANMDYLDNVDRRCNIDSILPDVKSVFL